MYFYGSYSRGALESHWKTEHKDILERQKAADVAKKKAKKEGKEAKPKAAGKRKALAGPEAKRKNKEGQAEGIIGTGTVVL